MFATKDRLPHGAATFPRPVTVAAPAGIISDLRQESQMPPFAFSSLRTLLPTQKLQGPHFHPLPHSLKNAQNITPAFPITSPLFIRSCARVQISTPLFSIAHALFVKTTGGRGGVRSPLFLTFHSRF